MPVANLKYCSARPRGGVKLVVRLSVAGGASDPFMLPPCTVGGNQARSDARSEFKILERSPKGLLEGKYWGSIKRARA